MFQMVKTAERMEERGSHPIKSSKNRNWEFHYSKRISETIHLCRWSNPAERKESKDVSCAASGWPLPLSWPYKKEGLVDHLNISKTVTLCKNIL